MDWFMQNVEDAARWVSLYQRLEAAARARKKFGGVLPRKEIVFSKSVRAFLRDRLTVLAGQTTVCYGVSGCGKTTAAEYLLRGNYANRPHRAIMIEAEGATNIAAKFSRKLAAPAAEDHIVNILCAAVRTPAEVNRYSNSLWGVAARWIQRANCLPPSVDEHDDVLVAEPAWTGNNPKKIAPLIIIDDLARSEKNREFVAELYTEAHAAQVNVLILTKDKDWANDIIAINGGVKILPMEEVINNPRKRPDERFTEIPEWTGMYWDEADIKALVKMYQVGDIDFHGSMTPYQVYQQQNARENAEDAFDLP